MKITVTYDVDEEMIETIENILEWYEPTDFEHQDDREVFLTDIAQSLIDIYSPLSLEESIYRMVEEYLKKKGWISGD
jgi:hypothetical protein